jgi:hypothetical protein
VARPECSSYRDEWWDNKLKGAKTPKGRVTVLQNKILADVSKLPEGLQDEMYERIASILEDALEEVALQSREGVWM